MKKTVKVGNHAKLCYNTTDQNWKIQYKVGKKWTNPSGASPFLKGRDPVSPEYIQEQLELWKPRAHLIGSFSAGEIDSVTFMKRALRLGLTQARINTVIMRVTTHVRTDVKPL